MKNEPTENEVELGKHQISFDQQPVVTKELEILNDQVEKTIGKETTRLHEIIQKETENAPLCASPLL